MRDATALLSEIVETAERFVCERWRQLMLPELLDRLRDEVAAELRVPAPDGRLVDDECALMVQVLAMAVRADRVGDGERKRLFLQIAGALLPALRLALGRALDTRRNP